MIERLVKLHVVSECIRCRSWLWMIRFATKINDMRHAHEYTNRIIIYMTRYFAAELRWTYAARNKSRWHRGCSVTNSVRRNQTLLSLLSSNVEHRRYLCVHVCVCIHAEHVYACMDVCLYVCKSCFATLQLEAARPSWGSNVHVHVHVILF